MDQDQDRDTLAPDPIAHAIGVLLTVCDNLTAAFQEPLALDRQPYVDEARRLLLDVDYAGWQRRGKVYSFSRVE